MQNKKNAIIITLLVILILIAGYIAFFKGTSEQKNNNYQSQENKNNPKTAVSVNTTDQTNQKFSIYKNIKAGYEVNYPSSWNVVSKTESSSLSNFQIENISGAVLSGSDFSMKGNGSLISVQVSYGVLANGINMSNYPTIDDLIKDPKFGLPPKVASERLTHVSLMNIGGQNLRVEKLDSSNNEVYSFIYNSKAYNISFMSGSQAQYSVDYKTFTDFVASFNLQ